MSRRLRAAGGVPATLYGRGMEPLSLAVNARALGHALATDAGLNVLIDLQVGEGSHLALARVLDKHPIRGHFIHVDFLKIARDEVITVDVSIHFEGESRGVKEGAQLETHVWQLHVECLPTAVPERINVDISNLAVGDILRVGDIVAPEGVTILNPAEDIVTSCVVPQDMKVEAETEVPTIGEITPVAEGTEGAKAEG